MKTGQYLILAFICFCLYEIGHCDEPTNKFTGDLLKTLYVNPEKEDNTIFSSVSLYTLLGLIEQGSKGTTLNELATVLYADANTTRQNYQSLVRNVKSVHNGTTLEIANNIYVENNFNINPGFRQVAVDNFDADIENIEFKNAESAADIINTWVSNKTHGRITKLFDPQGISPDTVMMLLNAIYFNGKWLYSFNPNDTKDATFTTLSGGSSIAPMMYLNKKHLVAGELSDIGAKYVRLPFKDEDFSLIAVVPDSPTGLTSVVNQLSGDHLSAILQNTNTRNVQLKMPKFKFSTTSQLIPTLQDMGLNNIFTSAADLTGIASYSLEISTVLQKAEIEVDEEGATASAVTGIGISITSVIINEPPILVINADHPFIIFITYGSDSLPLFTGWVGNP